MKSKKKGRKKWIIIAIIVVWACGTIGKVSLNNKVSVAMLSTAGGVVVLTCFFWGRRLKKCSKPMPLDITKLVAEFRLTLMTELSDSVCEL